MQNNDAWFAGKVCATSAGGVGYYERCGRPKAGLILQ
jgi:hypothetical protein